jgi:ActR/RegA family two-component response regulator
MNDMNLPASSAFVGRVLVVSDDVITIQQLSESMQRFALSVERCTEVSSALARLRRSKFEAVIVDFRLGSQAGAVLEETRHSASNEHAVLFTVSDNEAETTDAFKAGSTFVIRRPLSVHINRPEPESCLRADRKREAALLPLPDGGSSGNS